MSITESLVQVKGCVIAAAVVSIDGETGDAGKWAAYTLAGSLVASSASYLLKKVHDTGRILVGRSLVSLVIGVCGSRFTAHWYPAMASDSLILFGIGAAFGLVGYAVSYPLVNALDRASPKVVNAVVRRGARKLLGEKEKED